MKVPSASAASFRAGDGSSAGCTPTLVLASVPRDEAAFKALAFRLGVANRALNLVDFSLRAMLDFARG